MHPRGRRRSTSPRPRKNPSSLAPCSRWLSSRLRSWAACWPISSPCGAPRRRKSSSCPRQRPRLPAAPKPRNRNVKPLPVRQRAKQLLPVRLLPPPPPPAKLRPALPPPSRRSPPAARLLPRRHPVQPVVPRPPALPAKRGEARFFGQQCIQHGFFGGCCQLCCPGKRDPDADPCRRQ